MRILIFCNTYSQLIEALQIRKMRGEADEVHVILSDMSANACNVYKRLEQIECFNSVHFVKTNISKKTPVKKIILKGIEVINAICDKAIDFLKRDAYYDEFIYHNDDFMVWRIFGIIIKKNPSLKVNRFEEGLLSYSKEPGNGLRDILVVKIRRMLKKKSLIDVTENYYCYNPGFYKGNLTPVAIDKIDIGDKVLKTYINKIFFAGKGQDVCREKYIFFPSILDNEGGKKIGELELAIDIAKVVGRDNLIIKVHPRDSKERFEKCGLKVFQNSDAPWEAIQLSGDYSEKIFLTVCSGSVFSINAILKDTPQIFFLYNLCDYSGNPLALRTINNMKDVISMSNGLIGQVNVISDVEDILDEKNLQC